jgi:putative aldouronate transport system permease protein
VVAMRIKRTAAESAFAGANAVLMCGLALLTAYPLLYVLFASLSRAELLISHTGVLFAPLGFQVGAYGLVFQNPNILSGYLNTIVIVVSGVLLNVVLTVLGGYFLSRKGVPLRNAVMFFIVFTMFFSGGLVPFYLTVRGYGIDNTLLALILPVAVNTFNMIIMRTAFASVPDAMEESATIDGASHYVVLFRIYFPLALPTIAVLVLYYGVGHWNAWFNAMIFLRKRELFPLQLILREILIQNDTTYMVQNVATGDEAMVRETVKYAVIVVATAPILALYPFLQKYFVKGVMVGALKE